MKVFIFTFRFQGEEVELPIYSNDDDTEEIATKTAQDYLCRYYSKETVRTLRLKMVK